MASSWMLIFFIIFTAYSHQISIANNIPLQLNDDVLGLICFKSELSDPTSYLSSWNEDDNTPCSWNYIKCNPINGRVSELSLAGLGLSGKIGRGLERLQNLKVLSLSQNNLSGEIPPQLALIFGLQTLNLSHNRLSGRVPDDLCNMTSIKFLDFSLNSLSGPVPDRLFENWFSLRFVSLSGNSFEGPIPSTLPNCTLLQGLNLSNNHFSGNTDFSNGIWSLTKLRILDLSHNLFSGSVPQGISSLHYLKELNLQGNQFSGPLPSDIGLCPHLNYLDFSNNLFSGALPDSIQKLNSLPIIRLADNRFTSDLPHWISNMSSIQLLDFSNNEFSGNLPASLGDLKSLKFLSLSHNKLEGEIPTTLFDLALEELDLSVNGFNGPIPPGSTRLFESLHLLDLSNNKLIGDIPPEMGLCFNLRYLNLSWNNLKSRLPPELGYFQNLSVLDLRNSGLYGSIPEDLCDSNSLNVLQLDGNSLNGPIPEEIRNCSALYLLSLSHNRLNGFIPKAIASLKKLKILKLEFNNLSGEIPQQLGSLDNLLAVNISYNRLVGRLPIAGIFPSLDQSSLQGNLGLCSPILTGPCKMNVPKPLVINPFAYPKGNNSGNLVPESNSLKSKPRIFLSISAIVAISAAVLIVIGVLVITILNFSTRRRLAFVENAMESMCSTPRSRAPAMGKLVFFGPNSDLRYEDWINNAELLLNKASEIGRGVFGTVYKASVGGRIVAIKKLITSNIIQYQEDFNKEVRILGKVRHPNLLTLKGYYWTPQLQLLISDYAPIGSLHAKLHQRSTSSPPLSWANRFKIALGTAKGLAHLHQFRPPIIHYNIKPSNILLDENYNAMISDFGLARLLPKLDKHVLSTRFQTALGYVAPELACQSSRISEKCDIYAFGVVILELVTRRRPMEYGEDDVVVLIDHVRVQLEQGNALDCVDLSMNEYPEEEVLPVLKLGLVCTSQLPSSRPSMAEVVQILQVIKTPIQDRMEAF
ncbi:uncharacterized protein LOC143861020 [Tasmannia lanceolata]|uniref:uncharacterized protein LOC143861020 n=1 Tax=Tasmannia lanceolata TaxID=3420 RepID=UPI0040632E1E